MKISSSITNPRAENLLVPLYADNADNEDNQQFSFEVSTSDFIKRIVDLLLTTQIKIEHNIEDTKFHCSESKMELINSTLLKLENTIFFEEGQSAKNKNFISVSLKRLQNFEEGEFSFKLTVKELDDKYVMIKHDKAIISYKKLKLLNPQSKINLYELSFEPHDITFQEVYLSILPYQGLNQFLKNGGNINQKTIIIKHIELDKQNNKEENKQKNASSNKLLKRLTNLDDNLSSKRFNYKPSKTLLEKDYSPIKGKNSIDNDINESFIRKTDIIYSPVEFDISDFSGLNLYSFGLTIERNGEYYGNSEELFFDFLLLHSDELIKYDIIDSNYNTILKISEDILLNSANVNKNRDNISVILGIQLNLDKATRKSILNRLKETYFEFRIIKAKQEELISDISYLFEEIKEKLLSILNNTELEATRGCCGTDKCLVY